MNSSPFNPLGEDDYTTAEAARLLGLAVRSVQLMVDRGELQAWKTPGGHRRIARASVQAWMAQRRQPSAATPAAGPAVAAAQREPAPAHGRPCVLLIEDSRHYQNLIRLLFEQEFPHLQLHVADDGYSGLAMAGRLEPDLLLVDILLPGMDGAMLINSLRRLPFFEHSEVAVITSLSTAEQQPYQHALQGVPVVPKAQLLTELPALLRRLPLSRPAPTSDVAA